MKDKYKDLRLYLDKFFGHDKNIFYSICIDILRFS